MPKFIITEEEKKSILKMYGLNEQEQTRSLPTIEFEEAFPNNMIDLYNREAYGRAIQELDNEINSASQGNENLDLISITIRSGHSPENATNRLPDGFKIPDHNYGGLQGMTTEVCPTGEKKLNNGLGCWIKFGDNQWKDNYTRIIEGNVFLAKQRGLKLKAMLEQYLRKKYPNAKSITITVDENIGTDRKFVSAVINSVVSKKPTEPVKTTKDIYNFYIEDLATQFENIWYIPVSPSLVGWGNKKPTSLEDATNIMKSIIKGRNVLVKNFPITKGSQYETSYGQFRPYIEIKNYSSVGNSDAESVTDLGDGSKDEAKKFSYKEYDIWNKEVQYIDQFKAQKHQGTVDQAKTNGSAGYLPRQAPAQKQQQPQTTVRPR